MPEYHLTLSQIADRAEAIASEAADHHLRQDALALMHRADAGDPDALSPALSDDLADICRRHGVAVLNLAWLHA